MKRFLLGLFLLLPICFLCPHLSKGIGNDNPTGVAGQYYGSVTTAGSYDPYTGNASRFIDDITVPGSVGAYPLKWTRALNTRNITANGKHGAGGWTASYDWHMWVRKSTHPLHWNDADPDYEGPDARVSYPDGREVPFEGELGGPYWAMDTADSVVRLVRLEGQNYDLLLPDGGKVQFRATSYQIGTVTHYTTPVATAIIDPYGQASTLTRDTSNRLWKITEPGGRRLEITYGLTVLLNIPRVVVNDVRAYDSRNNLTQAVHYVYDSLGSCRYLKQVDYDSGDHAFYTYQEANGGNGIGTALISTCDDVRYAGAMKKIRYEYTTWSQTHGPADYGQIKAEKNKTTGEIISQIIYPVVGLQWNDPLAYQRTEKRGDDATATRVFQYSYSSDNTESFTDFENHLTKTTYEFDVPLNRSYKIIEDARNHKTRTERQIFPILAVKSVKYHDNSKVEFEYTDANNPYYLAWRKDENLQTTTYTRDSVTHQVTRVDYPNGGWEEFIYNSLDQVITHKRPAEFADAAYDHSEYDQWGRLVKRWNATNSASYPPINTPYVGYVYYDSGGPEGDRLRFVDDQLNNRTEYLYDERGNLARVNHPGSAFTQSVYNPDGTLAQSTDELFHTTVFVYDEYKRVISVENSEHEITRNYYYPDPSLAAVRSLRHTTSSVSLTTSPMLKEVRLEYDRNFRRTKSIQAPGTEDQAVSSVTYDPVGNVMVAKDPRLKTTSFGYDERNRQLWVRNDELNETTAFTYDAAGNKTKETRQDTRFRTWSYDAMNQLSHTYDWRTPSEQSQAPTATYIRDLAGNVQTITNARGEHYEFDYDLMNRKINSRYPLGGIEAYGYDDGGNLLVQKTPSGKWKHIHYDPRNRPDRSYWNHSSESTTAVRAVGPEMDTVLDSASRVTSIVTNGGETSIVFEYDNANRKLWEEQTVAGQPTHRVKTDLDDEGKRTNLQLVDPNESLIGSPEMQGSGTLSVEFEYTHRNQLKNIFGENHAWAFNYSYDLNGNMTAREAVYNGHSNVTNGLNYDALNRPKEWGQVGSEGFQALSHYKFDQANREIATWRDENNGKGERFTYEPTNQLKTAVYNADGVSGQGEPGNRERTVNYGYSTDKLNRSTVTESFHPAGTGGQVTTYTPNALNQYTAVGGTSYGYDANFNLTSSGTFFSAVYDAANRLVSATNSAGEASAHSAHFVYDGLGRCVKRTVDGVATIFVFDGWKPIGEFDAWGNLQAWNLYGPGADEILLRHEDKIGYLRFQLDRRGNVAFLVDNDGAVVEKYQYDAFGRATVTDWNDPDGQHPRWSSNYQHRFLFQGREYLHEIGIYDYRNRFYHAALGRFLQSDPTGFSGGDMNLFRYCGDDPVDHSDPTGEYYHLVSDGNGNYTIKIPITYDGPGATKTVTDRFANGITGLSRGNVKFEVFTAKWWQRSNLVTVRAGVGVGGFGVERGSDRALFWYAGGARNVFGVPYISPEMGARHSVCHFLGLPEGYDIKTGKTLPGYEGNVMDYHPGGSLSDDQISSLTHPGTKARWKNRLGFLGQAGGGLLGENVNGGGMWNSGLGWNPIGSASSNMRWTRNIGTGNWQAAEATEDYMLGGGENHGEGFHPSGPK